jgi:hypothetical protein
MEGNVTHTSTVEFMTDDTDDASHLRFKYDGRLLHSISVGSTSIVATRPNLVKIAAAIAASMEAEDTACE